MKKSCQNTVQNNAMPSKPFFGGTATAQPFFPLKSVIQKQDAAVLPNPYVISDEERDAVRERLLEPFREHRSTTFTTRLRGLSPREADAMRTDDAFWQEMRRVFRGRALWAVYKILYLYNRSPEPDRRLYLELHRERATQFMDALALVIEAGRPTEYFDFLEEAVRYEFREDPRLNEILRLISQRNTPGAVETVNFTSAQVHYETNADGDQELRRYSISPRMTIYHSGDSFRVVVRIRFTSGANPSLSHYFFPDSATPENWRSAIESNWNNKFIITNGVRRLNFEVAPMFYYDDEPVDKVVKVMESTDLSCAPNLSPGRANAGCWFTESSDRTVAHEFGHLMGAADEYNIPATVNEIPADIRSTLTDEDLPFTTVEGITGETRDVDDEGYDMDTLMGSRPHTSVSPRHIRRLFMQLNSQLPAGTPPYRIIER